jgi:hypothetical protein
MPFGERFASRTSALKGRPQDFLAARDKVVVLGRSREGPRGSGSSELVAQFRRWQAHA